MFSTHIYRRIYFKVTIALVIAILTGVIAPPGSASADAMSIFHPEAMTYRYADRPMSILPNIDPLSLVSDMLDVENLTENLNMSPELAEMVPSFDPDGKPVGFLMNPEAMQQQTQFEPSALAEPISLSRVQSTYVASGGVTDTVVLTYTVTNNQSPVNVPDQPEGATITDTINAISSIDFSNDPNVVHNVVIADGLTTNATWLDADPLPDRKDDEFIWNLGDVPPLGTITVTLRIEVPGSIADFVDLDQGATAYGTLQGRAVSASTAPATLAPEEFAQWLVWTVDADYYDEYAVSKSTELGNNWQNIWEYVRSLGYESYKGSLRGARGTLWSEAGNSVDQASLLVALLRGSGIPARYRHGALSTARAQELILSMFPEPQGVIGHIPEGAEVADPANDPQLLEETVDHWWAEAYLPGQGWTHLAPSFSYTTPCTRQPEPPGRRNPAQGAQV
jgi:transglutaminase-like putative cysteine protease